MRTTYVHYYTLLYCGLYILKSLRLAGRAGHSRQRPLTVLLIRKQNPTYRQPKKLSFSESIRFRGMKHRRSIVR